MTTDKLLDELRAERITLNAMIDYIERKLDQRTKILTRNHILNTVKENDPTKRGYKYKGKHWTQTVKGKAKMRRIQKARYKAMKKNG